MSAEYDVIQPRSQGFPLIIGRSSGFKVGCNRAEFPIQVVAPVSVSVSVYLFSQIISTLIMKYMLDRYLTLLGGRCN